MRQQINHTEVVFAGFPDNQELIEPMSIVQAVLGGLNISNIHTEVTSACCMRKNVQHNAADTSHDGSTAHATNTSTRISIAATCSNSATVNKIITASKSVGRLKYSQLDASKLSTNTQNFFTSKGNFDIIINELLPSSVFKLLKDAKNTLKPAGFKYVWAKNSLVHAKWHETSFTHHIMGARDIEKLTTLYKNQNSIPQPLNLQQNNINNTQPQQDIQQQQQQLLVIQLQNTQLQQKIQQKQQQPQQQKSQQQQPLDIQLQNTLSQKNTQQKQQQLQQQKSQTLQQLNVTQVTQDTQKAKSVQSLWLATGQSTVVTSNSHNATTASSQNASSNAHPGLQNSVDICCTNINSLRAHLDNLKFHLDCHPNQFIIAVTETWL